MTRFRLGFAPITWNNEDLGEELGAPVPFTTILDEVAATGYEATELGDGFPREAARLRSALEERGLRLPSAWCGLSLDVVDQDVEHTRQLCDLLAASGASFVNLAHQGTPATLATAGRNAGRSHPPEIWDRIEDSVCRTAEVAREFGLQALFHVHAGTLVETHEEMQELLRRVPSPLLKLCWDVGHALYGGIDPVAVVRDHADRVAYVHLKDLDGQVLAGLHGENLGFLDGVRRRVFCELGTGLLDVPGLLSALDDNDYDGWLMVEQDSTWLAPIESARVSRAYLRSLGV